jgi:adenine-specific DNA-methyltransferase
MPLPPLENIQEIGNKIILQNNFSEIDIDLLINHYFNIEKTLEEIYKEIH